MKAALRMVRAFPGLRVDDLLAESRRFYLAADILGEERQWALEAAQRVEDNQWFSDSGGAINV